MKTITSGIRKGGTGKTTTLYHVASILSIRYKVICIDVDSQGSLTTLFDINLNNLAKKDFLDVKLVPINENLSILPCSISLSEIEVDIMNQRVGVDFWLRNKIISKLPKCDYLLIDTPPSFDIFTINAYNCSDFIIMPVDPSPLTYEGVVTTSRVLQNIKENVNPHFRVGILYNMVNEGTVLAEAIPQVIGENFDNYYIFKNRIPFSQEIKNISGLKQSILDTKKSSKMITKLKNNYADVSAELVELLG